MTLQLVAEILRRRRTEGWLVGGCVRDRELGRRSPDLDVVVADDPAGVAKDVAAQLASPWFALSRRYGSYRVMGPTGHIDVAGLRGSGIVDDLSMRDFTINAVAVGIETGAVVDPFGGLEHLRQGLLVAVSARIFADDPLRLMRAPRFCQLLGLRLDPELEVAIQQEAAGLDGVAAERIAAEMALTLGKEGSATAVRLWQRLGLLAVLFPELSKDEALAVGALLDGLDDVMARSETWFPSSAGAVSQRLARPVDGGLARPAALRTAALVHRLPVDEAVAAGRRLKLSAAAISLLGALSGCFHRGECSPAALANSASTDRIAVLFLWEAAPWEPEVIMLAAASAVASPSDPGGGAPMRGARRLLALWEDREFRGVPRPPVDGFRVMRELGLEGGPLLGGVLREVRLACEAGEVSTEDEALAVARRVLARA